MQVLESPAWQALSVHAKKMEQVAMHQLFAEDAARAEKFSLAIDADFWVDFSKSRVSAETLQLLLALARQQKLSDWIERLLSGEVVNDTEQRPALHSALRALGSDVHGFAAEVQPAVQQQLNKMAKMVEKIRQGQWRGFSGQPIQDVVNIGVGGSDLGPLMVTHALQEIAAPVRLHFVSSIDGSQVSNLLNQLNPKTTLFILASKSFTTIDTLSNAETALNWLRETGAADELLYAQHWIGVSTRPDRMRDWGICPENQLEFWDWVGGRYSLWSTIGLPIALHIGMQGFQALLQGAKLVDQHFAQEDLAHNLPVLLGLIDIWHNNFLGYHAKAILPYDARMKYFPAYCEQLVMESNGKSVNRQGEKVCYRTCPILWGEVGPNAQHAFYQLLHQGTQKVMCDFIVSAQRSEAGLEVGQYAQNKDQSLVKQHALALANCFAQSRVLMLGDAAIPEHLKSQFDSPFKHYPGNQPSNTFVLSRLSPKTLGMLIALYEHKTFVESVIWEINPFDQWGVELGKLIAQETYQALSNPGLAENFDASTHRLIQQVTQEVKQKK